MKIPPALLRSRRGATLVELTVCLALLGLFSVAAVALVRPFAEQFTRLQRLSRAQMIADTIVEELRADLLYAEGTLRLADAAADGGDPAGVFGPSGSQQAEGYGQGTTGSAVECMTSGNFYLLLDAGAVPETVVLREYEQPDGTLAQERITWPARSAGTLHKRYYSAASAAENAGQAYTYTYRQSGEGGPYYTAYGYADAYADAFYMGDAVALQFTVQGFETDAQGRVRVTSLAAEVSVRRADSGQLLYTRRAVLDLPNRPVLLQDPGDTPGRDGSAAP